MTKLPRRNAITERIIEEGRYIQDILDSIKVVKEEKAAFLANNKWDAKLRNKLWEFDYQLFVLDQELDSVKSRIKFIIETGLF